MRRMKLSEINILPSFAESTPNEEKVCECRYNWRVYHKQDRYIVVDDEGYLIDGYIMYKILIEHKEEYAQVKISNCRKKRWYRKNTEDWNIPHYRNEPTTYIYGKHYNENTEEYSKEYVWRVPKSWSDLDWENGLAAGDEILVDTKCGIKKIIITKIERNNVCPIDMPVRRVLRRINN